jgi:hypothetical protein
MAPFPGKKHGRTALGAVRFGTLGVYTDAAGRQSPDDESQLVERTSGGCRMPIQITGKS